MDASTWIALVGVGIGACGITATGIAVYVSIREAIAELRTGFRGVLELLNKQDERITFMEQRSMTHHPPKDQN